MHDIKYIRENSDQFDAAMARRGFEDKQSTPILALDEERRALQTELQELQAERNGASKQIGVLHNPKSFGDLSDKERGVQIASMTERVKALKDEMEALEEMERTKAGDLAAHLAGLPNVMFDDVPDGADEDENVELRKGSAAIKLASGPDHVEIGEALGMMDFEAAAKMSGARFVLLSGGLARLERALAQFMLDVHTQEHGYTEVSPPLLVRDNALYGTGQLPKFEMDLFKASSLNVKMILHNYEKKLEVDTVELREKGAGLDEVAERQKVRNAEFRENLTKEDYQNRHWLIPTAEVSLTNIVAGEIVEEGSLPRRYTAHTPCFRSEAGSAGRDTRGMLRQHQFYKVEMVSIVKPEESAAEHERMTKCAEVILENLEIPFRTVMLCSGDTGFGAKKTYDIEAWLPGQEAYREISSVSNCGDFQARRMNARYKPEGEKKTQFVHTLNGSGVAVGRCLIAVMENYWDLNAQVINVPEVLKPYMGGLEKIEKI